MKEPGWSRGKRWLVLLAAALIAAATPLAAAATPLTTAATATTAAATATTAAQEPTIQPGVPIRTGNAGCTLNWIYDRWVPDPDTGELVHEGVYGGTAAHCVQQVGQDVHLLDQQLGAALLRIGVVAFIAPVHDYAFVRVDDDRLGIVDPALKGHPAIPTGVSTTATARVGDLIRFSGNGVGWHAHQTTQEQRVGLLCHNNGIQHYVYGPVTQGDSGGPVANETDGNKALGLVTTVGVAGSIPAYACAGEGGVSLEGMFEDARDQGWDMRLRTVPAG